jgi:hypothetical protein
MTDLAEQFVTIREGVAKDVAWVLRFGHVWR